MPTDHLPLQSAGPAVRDAMMFEPRPTPASTTLGQARELFANPRVKLLLVTDGDGRFLGTLTRDDVPSEGDGPIADHVDPDAQRIDPGAPVAQAVEMLDGTGTNRLPVVGDDGLLQGLVCWDRAGQQFCVDPGRVTS
jgi:CBS-domain-containing membrane protein